MSEKRRDSKGRVLRTGESQRPDGRYTYKYIDATGKPQFVYSWKLEPRDGLPQGKHNDLSLREKIKQIYAPARSLAAKNAYQEKIAPDMQGELSYRLHKHMNAVIYGRR